MQRKSQPHAVRAQGAEGRGLIRASTIFTRRRVFWMFFVGLHALSDCRAFGSTSKADECYGRPKRHGVRSTGLFLIQKKKHTINVTHGTHHAQGDVYIGEGARVTRAQNQETQGHTGWEKKNGIRERA